MATFDRQEQERIDFMRAIALEVSNNEPAVLKGGTSLLLTHNLDRFSEDMDFDLPPGTASDFRKHIMKAAETIGIAVDGINIKKDTETTKRYMVHYTSAFSEKDYPLKIECSMRNEIEKADVENINGIKVYSVPRLAELKAEAFVNRDKARDTYDIAFLTENYPSEIKQTTWALIREHVQDRGIEGLCDSFDKEREQDKLLSNFEGTEVVLRIQENIERHQSRENVPECESEPTITPQRDKPNMAEVQAAESKASLVQGLDKSADGNSLIEGQDIGYAEEGYVAAATQVKHEAQQARTADGEIKNQGINPQVGQRVSFQPHGSDVKLTGNVVAVDDKTVTMKCGNKEIPTIREKGAFSAVPVLAQDHTKEHAKDQAQKLTGGKGNVFFAQKEGTYKGEIIGKTPTFAIQKINGETTILHRLKDLETKGKDGQGSIKEGENLSIVKDRTGVTVEPWDKEREEKEKVRERQKSRGSQIR